MVAKFCAKSHGHPFCGVRSAAMMSRSRPISREGVMGDSRIACGKPLSDLVIAGQRAWPETAGASPGFSVAGQVGFAACLEQEPGSPLGLIDKVFQKARGGDVLVVVANFVARAHGRD